MSAQPNSTPGSPRLSFNSRVQVVQPSCCRGQVDDLTLSTTPLPLGSRIEGNHLGLNVPPPTPSKAVGEATATTTACDDSNESPDTTGCDSADNVVPGILLPSLLMARSRGQTILSGNETEVTNASIPRSGCGSGSGFPSPNSSSRSCQGFSTTGSTGSELEETDTGTSIDPVAPPSGDPSEEESIALARELMAQEALESYAMFSSEYFRYNTAQYSAEDLEALRAALEDDIDADSERGTNGDQYEIMLQLGEAIGDVKKERWKMVANEHIHSLPTLQFNREEVEQLDENDSRRKCLVCQFVYEQGQTLRTLPCGHCFHSECIDQWLKDTDSCAYCRQPIIRET